MEQAAIYLHDHAERDSKVASWYSNLFDLFYGQDVDDIPIALELSPEQLQALLSEDYLVIYVHQWQRGTPQNLLDALTPLTPEYTLRINGLDYVRIYHLTQN